MYTLNRRATALYTTYKYPFPILSKNYFVSNNKDMHRVGAFCFYELIKSFDKLINSLPPIIM